jgi:hypothetical protein
MPMARFRASFLATCPSLILDTQSRPALHPCSRKGLQLNPLYTETDLRALDAKVRLLRQHDPPAVLPDCRAGQAWRPARAAAALTAGSAHARAAGRPAACMASPAQTPNALLISCSAWTARAHTWHDRHILSGPADPGQCISDFPIHHPACQPCPGM